MPHLMNLLLQNKFSQPVKQRQLNQQELEVIILLPHSHDLRSLLSLFLLRNFEPFLMIQRGKAALEMLVDNNWNRLGVVSFVK